MVPITDFFGSVRKIEISNNPVNLSVVETKATPGESLEDEDEAEEPVVQQKAVFTYVDQLPIDPLLSQR